MQDYELSYHPTDIKRCCMTYKVLSIFSPELYKGCVSLLFISSTNDIYGTELVVYKIRTSFYDVDMVLFHVCNI